MTAAHITAVHALPTGAHSITCSCGASSTRAIPRDEALVVGWAHEDHWANRAAAKSRRRAQVKARRARERAQQRRRH